METDWLELWRELIVAGRHTTHGESHKGYKNRMSQIQQRPDPLLDFVLKSIDREVTVLEIGAGTGRWTLPLARVARTVTAVEPAGYMLKTLRENIAEQGNIQIIPSSWQEAVVRTHDIVVCAHGMYSSPDFALFVRKMEQSAGRTCYMVIRFPPVDGIIGILSKAIHGSVHDSANAVIAYNALYSLGIYPNVLVQNDYHRWLSSSLEEAFTRAKEHLHLESVGDYDGLIRKTLSERLIPSDGSYLWHDGMRSALFWWSPSPVRRASQA